MELRDAGSCGVIIVVDLIEMTVAIRLALCARVRVTYHVHSWQQLLSSGGASRAALAPHRREMLRGGLTTSSTLVASRPRVRMLGASERLGVRPRAIAPCLVAMLGDIVSFRGRRVRILQGVWRFVLVLLLVLPRFLDGTKAAGLLMLGLF